MKRPYAETDVLTKRELARHLKRSERTIERLRLPQIVPGRYLLGDVLKALREGRAA